ncbi:MAG: sigma 54-interacting transcriptional regulator [Verrucomicrobiales bacterium]|nr:sigma 54-interacting transcriptional regulator [Verrucomicrobiales bacterium]
MDIECWLHSWEEASEEKQDQLREALVSEGVKAEPLHGGPPGKPGVCIFGEITTEVRDFVQAMSGAGREHFIAIAASGHCPNGTGDWDLLRAGASDVLVWSEPDRVARQIKARFERWLSVEQMMKEPTVSELVVAKCPVWRTILRDIVEIARFSDGNVLIQGESGTGKEVITQLIHLLDPRLNKRNLVVLDCASVVPELSGSEFFGHERGAFTGALTERHGAFALANGGTLFLDEIGELPLRLQAQLLRVVQEHTYKRVGGNTWCKTAFRLVCATNRDLLDLIGLGEFRADLYYRIAGYVCKLPPLRKRLEDIIPLAEHFLRQACPDGQSVELDGAVREFLLRREYPGNVRDLQQLVSRFIHRAGGDGTITIGCVPADERPVLKPDKTAWLDCHFEQPIQRAVLLGAPLKEIGRAAEDVAIRYATDEEDGNLQRAANRLGVTDRALQLRRANRRQMSDAN